MERPTLRLAETHDVRVISPVPYCPPLPQRGRLEQYARFRRIPRRELRHGVRVERPRFIVGPGNSTYALEGRAYYRGVVRAVDRLRETWPFDLIHAHFSYADGVAAARLAERYGVPFVVTEHAPWRPLADDASIREQLVTTARRAATTLAVSTSVRDSILAEAGPDVRVSVVPVGVDTELFRLGPPEDRRADQILFVGFLNYNKGVDVLLRAVAELRDRGERGTLLLVGGSHYRSTRLEEERLRGLAAELRLGERAAFLGRVPPDEVARLMRESAVVVLPSRAESFGAVLVEAMASGTPVVATRCGGPEDVVTDEVGRLVDRDDPRRLADALLAVLRDPARYPAERLREHAVRRYDWATIAARYADVYDGVLEGATVSAARRTS